MTRIFLVVLMAMQTTVFAADCEKECNKMVSSVETQCGNLKKELSKAPKGFDKKNELNKETIEKDCYDNLKNIKTYCLMDCNKKK